MGEGLVQVFRRSESPFIEAWFRLSAIDSEGRYEVEDLDSGTTAVMTGSALSEEGLAVALPERSSAAVFIYRRKA